MATTIPTYEEIENTVLDLPLTDRSRLATRILESLDEDDPEISDEWREELQRRVRDIDEGRAKMIPSEEVWRGINERFGTDFKA